MSDVNWDTVEFTINGTPIPAWLACAILGGVLLLGLAVIGTVVVAAVAMTKRRE